MIFLRSLLYNLLCYGSGMLFGTLSLFCWLLPARYRDRPMLLWVRFALWSLGWCCGIRVRVVDHNDRPLAAPAVIVAKHQSTWETWFLQLYFAPLSTIVKRELLMLPFFGWGLALFAPITIDRQARLNALRQVKAQGLARLRQSRNVLVFPEGTRVPFGKAGHYARSGADLAAAAAVPMIPVAHNAGRLWPSRSFKRYPGIITVIIGRPITASDGTSREAMVEAREWIEGQISAMDAAPVVASNVRTPRRKANAA